MHKPKVSKYYEEARTEEILLSAISAVRQGRTRPFTQILDISGSSVRRKVREMVKSRTIEPDDVVHDIFIKIFTWIKSPRSPGCPDKVPQTLREWRAWVHTVTFNHCLNVLALKANQPHDTLEDDEVIGPVDIERFHRSKKARALLRSKFKVLDQKRKSKKDGVPGHAYASVALGWYIGLSYKEMAHRLRKKKGLETTPGQLRVWCTRTFRKLRSSLTADEAEFIRTSLVAS
jgi:DNA-directed RNA polymerase specialized sigma24 family protein